MVLDKSTVGYVDFGITGVLAPASREHLMKMTLALARGDLRKLQDEFLEITVWGKDSDLEGFRAGLEELASGWYEGGVGGTLTASFTRIMSEMLKLSRTTRVMPERDIVKYIRSSIAIDGLISRFAPDFDLGAHLADRCARLLRTDLRRRFFGAERLLAAATAGARLLESGAPRGARLLDRLERLAEAELAPRPEGWRAAGLGAVVLAAAGLVAAADQPSLGLNLWTAEVAFFGGAALVLVAHLRRLGRA
jgi:predicted unusual protein kinase regulating ubiquinone biosynthesis (AarF/ABC1/UbiB family)